MKGKNIINECNKYRFHAGHGGVNEGLYEHEDE